MHKGILAGRMLEARRRIVKAAETAVVDHAVGPLLLDALYAAQQEKQPDVRALYELEAIGPIVETLNECLGEALAGQRTVAAAGLSQAEILAIPGLTKTSREAIAAHFASLEHDAPAE